MKLRVATRLRWGLLLPLFAMTSAVTSSASDITVGELVKQSKEVRAETIYQIYNSTVAKVLVLLRDSADTHGKEKTTERRQQDRKRADRLEEIAKHIEEETLAQAIARVKDTDLLENVMLGYFRVMESNQSKSDAKK